MENGMLAYINGKDSDHMLTVLLSLVWGVLHTATYYSQKAGNIDIIGTFLLSTALGLAAAGGLGWGVAKISKNDNLFLPTANWFLIVGCLVYIVFHHSPRGVIIIL